MQQIRLQVLEYDQDDDLMLFEISVTNLITSSSLKFYAYANAFQEFGKELIGFPKSIADVVTFEIGENVNTWSYYLLLKAFCYEQNGHSAIQIIIDNHKKVPETNKAQFYIVAFPADINKLGRLLSDWEPTLKGEFLWQIN